MFKKEGKQSIKKGGAIEGGEEDNGKRCELGE
jgi:hypothetical protein